MIPRGLQRRSAMPLVRSTCAGRPSTEAKTDAPPSRRLCGVHWWPFGLAATLVAEGNATEYSGPSVHIHCDRMTHAV
jgi:hypothetical protein